MPTSDLKTCPYCHQDKGPLAFAHDLKGTRDGYVDIRTVCGQCAERITRMRTRWDRAVRERVPLGLDIRGLGGPPMTDGQRYSGLGGTAGTYLTLPAPDPDLLGRSTDL